MSLTVGAHVNTQKMNIDLAQYGGVGGGLRPGVRPGVTAHWAGGEAGDGGGVPCHCHSGGHPTLLPAVCTLPSVLRYL